MGNLDNPQFRKGMQDAILRDKRADIEGELDETKFDFDLASFTHFVRDRGISDEELTGDDLHDFIRIGQLEGPESQREKREKKQGQMTTLREEWEKGKAEKIQAGKKTWSLGEY